VWTVAGGADYTGKPRPAVVVQDDDFDGTRSITICLFTTDPTEAPLFRIRVEPSEENGLRQSSALMVDKLTTVPREKVGARIGRLETSDVLRMNQAILVFLGLARSQRAG
jgi:mRNA interferase MazF